MFWWWLRLLLAAELAGGDPPGEHVNRPDFGAGTRESRGPPFLVACSSSGERIDERPDFAWVPPHRTSVELEEEDRRLLEGMRSDLLILLNE